MATTNEIEKIEPAETMDAGIGDAPIAVADAEIVDESKTSVDEPIDAEFGKIEDDGVFSDIDDIDEVCKIVSAAKREKDSETERQRMTKKAEKEKAMQEEEALKIRANRYIRKKMKRRAAAMLFCICIMSAVFGYVVAGIAIHIFFNPEVWIFVGSMGIFGMINTLMHTYMYRYIREEIYRK